MPFKVKVGIKLRAAGRTAEQLRTGMVAVQGQFVGDTLAAIEPGASATFTMNCHDFGPQLGPDVFTLYPKCYVTLPSFEGVPENEIDQEALAVELRAARDAIVARLQSLAIQDGEILSIHTKQYNGA